MTRVTNSIGVRRNVGAAQLRVLDGPDRGLEIALPQAGVVLGTDKACDVVLTDQFVSRRHCSVAASGVGAILRRRRNGMPTSFASRCTRRTGGASARPPT